MKKELAWRTFKRWFDIALWTIIVVQMWRWHSFMAGIVLGAAFFLAFTRFCDWLFRVDVRVDNGER